MHPLRIASFIAGLTVAFLLVGRVWLISVDRGTIPPVQGLPRSGSLTGGVVIAALEEHIQAQRIAARLKRLRLGGIARRRNWAPRRATPSASSASAARARSSRRVA
jgi:hypothetical protein